MTLTSAGETFLGYANRLLSLEAEARQAVNSVGPKGVFRVGTMESTAASRLPKPLADFHARWPEVSLELSMAASQELIEQVLDHTLACALVARPSGPLKDDRGGVDATQLDGVRVFVEDLLLILPKSHPPIAEPRGSGGRHGGRARTGLHLSADRGGVDRECPDAHGAPRQDP